ncbi:hypothetical protein ACE6H2_006429 [Prunus campanulata]
MTDQIKNRQRQDPSFVFPKRLQLWKDSEKKMTELWDIFIQAEQRSMELQEELEKQKDKLDNEECISAALTVESTFQRQEILNLKRRIAELEGQKPHIDHEPVEQKEEEKEKEKAEEKEEEKEEEEKEEEEKEEEKEEEDKEEEKKQEEKKKNAQSPDVPSRIQRLKNRERKRLQASCYEYEKDKQPKKKDAKKGDEEIPQFKLISSEEPSTQEDPLNQMEVCNYCTSSFLLFMFSALQFLISFLSICSQHKRHLSLMPQSHFLISQKEQTLMIRYL